MGREGVRSYKRMILGLVTLFYIPDERFPVLVRQYGCMSYAKKPIPTPKKAPVAGSILDGIGWVIGQAALPIPDFLYKKKKKK